MNRSHAALLLGVLLLANPLYADVLVPGPTYKYEAHEFDPDSVGNPAAFAIKTWDPTYRGPTADVVWNDESERRELKSLLKASEEGYNEPADDVSSAAENLLNDRFVVAEVEPDEWQVFEVDSERTDDTFRIEAERISTRRMVDELAVPISETPPHTQQLVREGHVETRKPVRSIVFVDGGTYYYLDRDGAEEYDGPLRALPWVLGVAGAALLGWWLYTHAETSEPVGAAGR